MTSNAFSNPKIWKGMDHRLFLTILRDTYGQGSRHVVKSLPRREDWLKRNVHHIYGAQLVTYFAYTDGLLGEKWVEIYGKRQKRELYTLRLVRHALTHCNGRLSKLDKPKKSSLGRPKDPVGYIRRFAKDLQMGKIVDDSGRVISSYFTISNGVVKLNSKASGRICGLFTLIMMRAKKIE